MNLLTLLSARRQLWQQGNSTVALSVATQAQIDAFNERLSQVSDRFMGQMKPAMLYRRVQVPIYDQSVTLPRGLQSLLGIKPVNDNNCACSPLAMYTRFHEFAQLGAGNGMWGCGCGAGVFPIADTAQTFRDPQPGFTLRVTSTATLGTVEFIGGYDPDWNEYFHSETVNIINGSVTTTRQWGGMPRIVKSETAVAAQLYSVDTTSSTATLIAVYAPSETNPAYQRYSLPHFPSNVNVARILSRLTFEPLTEDTDIVIPNRVGALKMGLIALNYEDKNQGETADDYWARGLHIIDLDKQEYEGDAEIPLIDAAPGFGCGNIPNVI